MRKVLQMLTHPAESPLHNSPTPIGAQTVAVAARLLTRGRTSRLPKDDVESLAISASPGNPAFCKNTGERYKCFTMGSIIDSTNSCILTDNLGLDPLVPVMATTITKAGFTAPFKVIAQ